MTVLLVDDTPLTRECLSISLNLCNRDLRALTAGSVADVASMLRDATPPDVVLCHLGGVASSDRRFFSLVEELVGVLGPTPLIVVADCEEAEAALETFRIGVRGYIPTSVGLSVTLEAIRLVGAGGTYIPPAFLQQLMRSAASPESRCPSMEETAGSADRVNGLTPRQIAVLRCLREGKANKIIAHDLGICESTVKVHVRNILRNLGVTNRTQAVYLTCNGAGLNNSRL